MGTRHLTAVFYQGEYRIAQYGQWDGYPEGQGIDALTFIRDALDRPKFEAKLLKLRDLTEDERKKVNDNKNWQKHYPHLSRDAGAGIMALVQDGEDGLYISKELNFAGESLFCEWAWVLDLDKNTFEAFRGFNHDKLDPSERFAAIPKESPDSQYEPVKFMASWPLDALPSNEDFLKTLEPKEEGEEAA